MKNKPLYRLQEQGFAFMILDKPNKHEFNES